MQPTLTAGETELQGLALSERLHARPPSRGDLVHWQILQIDHPARCGRFDARSRARDHGDTGAFGQRTQQYVIANDTGQLRTHHIGQSPAAPQPQAVDRRHAARTTLGIERVLMQQHLHFIDQHAPTAPVRALRQMLRTSLRPAPVRARRMPAAVRRSADAGANDPAMKPRGSSPHRRRPASTAWRTPGPLRCSTASAHRQAGVHR